VLDNREISVVLWLTIFLVWAFSKEEVRKASVGVAKAALAWKIVLCISMMAVYVAMVVLALYSVGLWNTGNLKVTFLWSLTAALAMVFDVGSIADDERYFQKAVRDGFKISVVLEFIINFYVLSLPLELLLVPTATILSCMLVIAEPDDSFKPVRAILNAILVLLGLGLLAYAGHRIYTDFQSFAQLATLTEFLLPILLTASFLPFLYLLVIAVSYETLFVRLQFLMNNPELRRFTRLQLIRKFGFDFRKLNRWAKRFRHDRPSTKEEVLTSIQSVRAQPKRTV
jgi:hypothetical protein